MFNKNKVSILIIIIITIIIIIIITIIIIIIINIISYNGHLESKVDIAVDSLIDFAKHLRIVN